MAGRGTVGSLPADLTSFVGRRRELDEVRRLLGESRLVTLTGVGGTGKTRLAVRVAAGLRRAFADGVWFVDLTQLRESGQSAQDVQHPDVLALLVTATLGLRGQGDGSPLRVLVEQLADRRMLLILDNCEHLLRASGILADALLRGCPALRILATSRELLAIAGEVPVLVPPLPTPARDHLPSRGDMDRCESVTLFVNRADAVVPGFGLTADNHFAVAGLCDRLDGLPLAIELAAAWVRALTPQQILDRLTDRFTLLNRGSRAGPRRQQTLRACVDWSFDLCAEPERLLWARLSVFAGGFELDAVEAVCADEKLPEVDLLVLVASLVDKSILVRADVRADQADAARYRMLETLRDYGRDRLCEAGEDAVLRGRHRDWCQRLVVRVRAEWVSDRQACWLARLRREHANLRAAVEFCLTEPGEAEAALRLVVTLPRLYWSAGGAFGEGRHWLDRALAQATAATALRAQALLVNSRLAGVQGDAAAGIRLLTEGEDLARRLNVSTELGHAAYLRGQGALMVNDLPVAVEALDRARTSLAGESERDLDLYLNVLLAFGTAAAAAGEHERAGACVREILAIVEPRGGILHKSYALWVGGLSSWRRGDLRQALAQEAESLRLKRTPGMDDRLGIGLCLEVLAWITADHHHRRAATLLGAAATLCADVGASVTSHLFLVGYHDACEQQTRDALGDAAFVGAFHHGRGLTYDDAIAYALEEPRQLVPAGRDDVSMPLTPRERQVADIIAQGLSNRDIAARLVISQRTVESHVEHILAKLGFTSRAHVAAWVARSHEPDS